MIESGFNQVQLDRCIATSDGEALILSVYERSAQTLRGFVSSVILSGRMTLTGRRESLHGAIFDNKEREPQWDAVYTQIVCGKQRVWHAVMVSRKLSKGGFLTTWKRCGSDMYTHLMRNTDLPLLPEWGTAIYQKMEEERYVSRNRIREYRGMNPIDVPLFDVPVTDLFYVHVWERMAKEYFEGLIKELFKEGKIRLSYTRNKECICVESLNDYMERYGRTIVEHLEKVIVPETPLNGEIESIALKRKRLFPQQCAVVNGIVSHLQKSPFVLMVEGMGVGKTIQSVSAVEKYYADKWLRVHPGKTPADIYKDPEALKYRVIVMCPGHMVEKWAKEIVEEVPFSTAEIIRDFSQLTALKKRGAERRGKEFFIISKDTAKLSYTSVPSVKSIGKRDIRYKVCNSCGTEYLQAGNACPRCGETGWHFKVKCLDCGHEFRGPGATCPQCGSRHIGKPTPLTRVTAAVCPECGQAAITASGTEVTSFMLRDFAKQTTRNSSCFWCGASLWKPFVKGVGKAKPESWVRCTRFANKARKTKTTEWVYKKELAEYKLQQGPMFVSVQQAEGGPRKYSPSLYIKRHLKGFFDFGIFDEAHLYKGGGSAQGQSMTDLVCATKKQLALTGTIAGGMAEHLFYLLFRLDPRRMIENGYRWGSPMKFTEHYGTMERMFEHDEDSCSYNVSSRGRQINSAKAKPGISPLIFTEFLLDRAVFLDITDMSRFLPDLKETVVTVEPDEEERVWMRDYNQVILRLKEKARQKGGMALLSIMLQFSLSYMDKPFGKSSLIHPFDGSVASMVPEHPEAWAEGHVSSKELKLLELLEKEVAAGRNCFVFAEFTGQPETNVTLRLKKIIEKRLKIKAAILDTKAVQPEDRERWIHEQAEVYRTRVVITNPRCVETGLDFVWDDENGVRFNFPTLIFYQLGYSLFTVIQASRRHYRLIQDQECHTYYMAWEGTIQKTVIELIASKYACTSAIQGQFSTEGLAAMAQGVDERTKLAKALADEDNVSGADLQGMFDVIGAARSADTRYDNVRRMKTWQEVVGESAYEQITAGKETVPEEALENTFFEGLEELASADGGADTVHEESEFEDPFELLGLFQPEEPVKKKRKRTPKQMDNAPGQFLFDLFDIELFEQ